jgi:hypothetical protein
LRDEAVIANLIDSTVERVLRSWNSLRNPVAGAIAKFKRSAYRLAGREHLIVFLGQAQALESLGAIQPPRAEAELLMSELMAGLTESDRRLLACWLEEWSWDAIGKELNISPDAARMRWKRLIPVLRHRITLDRPGSE